MPPRDATDRFLAKMGRYGRHIDIPFDVDLGELVNGHRVVARGLELSENGAVLHYEFVPGVVAEERDPRRGTYLDLFSLYTEDDAGTEYDDSDTGAFDSRSGGEASHGERELGGQVPAGATRLTLHFEPAPGWSPPTPCRRELFVDLVRKTVQDSP